MNMLCAVAVRHETGVHLCTLTRLVRTVMYGVPFFVIVVVAVVVVVVA